MSNGGPLTRPTGPGEPPHAARPVTSNGGPPTVLANLEIGTDGSTKRLFWVMHDPVRVIPIVRTGHQHLSLAMPPAISLEHASSISKKLPMRAILPTCPRSGQDH